MNTISKKEGDKKMIQSKEIWRKVFSLGCRGRLSLLVSKLRNFPELPSPRSIELLFQFLIFQCCLSLCLPA